MLRTALAMMALALAGCAGAGHKHAAPTFPEPPAFFAQTSLGSASFSGSVHGHDISSGAPQAGTFRMTFDMDGQHFSVAFRGPMEVLPVAEADTTVAGTSLIAVSGDGTGRGQWFTGSANAAHTSVSGDISSGGFDTGQWGFRGSWAGNRQ